MSWTNYVEKSGSGTGEIIRLCREAGLADPQFESMTGHFKTIIWRRGYGAGCRVDGPSQGAESGEVVGEVMGEVTGAESEGASRVASQGLVRGASQGLVGVIEILASANEALSSTAIANGFGKARANSYIKRMIATLIDDKIVDTTGERKRGARLQKYRLTAKGKLLAARLTKKRKAAK